jgi:hypothetical protein
LSHEHTMVDHTTKEAELLWAYVNMNRREAHTQL